MRQSRFESSLTPSATRSVSQAESQNFQTVPWSKLTSPFPLLGKHKYAEVGPEILAAAPVLLLTVLVRCSSTFPDAHESGATIWLLPNLNVVVPPFAQVTMSPVFMLSLRITPEPPVVASVHPLSLPDLLETVADTASQVAELVEVAAIALVDTNTPIPQTEIRVNIPTTGIERRRMGGSSGLLIQRQECVGSCAILILSVFPRTADSKYIEVANVETALLH
jgi:hypothetical protein